MKISVCMAIYNGEKYLKQQLESIISQLDAHDELLISDDSSTDASLDIIGSFKDARIKVYSKQMFHSPVYNFQNALQYASGDIIVLSDQDDLWEENKLEVIRESFKEEVSAISLKLYNGRCIDEKNRTLYYDLFEYLKVHEGLLQNILKNSFIGCNIAFTKGLLDIVLPFPKDIPMHDQWLATCAYLFGKVEFIDEKIFNYRLHSNNYTGKRTSLFQKIKWRYQLIKNLFVRYIYVKFSS